MQNVAITRRAAYALPLLLGILIPPAVVFDAPSVCPFEAATGVPCPLCGATRAFVAFGHADERWLDYGAVWVVAALAGVVLAVRPRLSVALGVGLVAWAWALLNAGAITS